MKDWKRKISLVIGVLVFVYFMNSTYSQWAADPKEVQMTIDKTIENLSVEENITVTRHAYLTNQFSKGEGFGGAGGMGASIIGIENATGFISTIRRNNLSEVYYTFETSKVALVKKYWAPSAQGIFEIKQKHKISAFSMYEVKSYDSEIVIFKKSSGLSWTLWTIVFAIIGGIAYLTTLVLLWLIEAVYYKVKNR